MSKAEEKEFVEGLALSLNGQEVGVLSHYSGGRNIFVFSPTYMAMPAEDRKTLTLSQLADKNFLSRPLISAHRLAPVFSNLLPEGSLREWMALLLQVDADNEFPLMAYTGSNLPGALKATPIRAGEVPKWALDHRQNIQPIQINVKHSANKFSLAGVQMKFSSTRIASHGNNDHFNINMESDDDSWIIKTPSVLHPFVPLNEYSSMRLAEAAGVEVPEFKLVALTQLNNLPDINLPDEHYAYAIKRFDRQRGTRVHTEDFAQVFQVYSRDKYQKFNYEQIASVLNHYSHKGLQNCQQLARRLLVNILLANGDAHLKNWSLIYADGIWPDLAPAYDIVSTLPYVPGEHSLALNLAKEKNWYELNLRSFQSWSERAQLPWPAIHIHLTETLEKARETWPNLLTELPMIESQKRQLKEHWRRLHPDFRI